MNTKEFDNLRPEEKLFCELYVSDKKLSGDIESCYRKAFNTESKHSSVKGRELLCRKDIQDYIVFIDCPEEIEPIEVRMLRKKMTNKLLKIAEECADDSYVDRRGNPINPASLRSVAVNAMKLVADLNGVKKQSSESTGSGSSDKGGGITFNVIVPQSATDVTVEQQTEEEAK